MKVFSWQPTGHPSATPITWADAANDPKAEADKIAPILLALGRSDRCLGVFHACDRSLKVRSTLVDLFANGPYVSEDIAWWTTFLTELKAKGVTPTWVVLDVESGANFWNVSLVAEAAAILANPTIVSRMPAALRVFQLASWTGWDNSFIAAFNSWCLKMSGDAIRQVTLGIFRKIYNHDPNICNYQDMNLSFATWDGNNWAQESNPVSRWSAPSCYLNNTGTRYTKDGFKLDPFWNSMADNLNRVRSTMAAKPFVIPWVSFASFTGTSARTYWLWDQQIQHIQATGVKYLLYWNPGASAADEARMHARLTASKKSKPLSLPALPLDAQSIVTGSVTSLYSDYVKEAA